MRLLGLAFLLLCGYYLRFYLLQGDPFTLVQLATLLGASTLLLAGALRRYWLTLAVAALGLAVLFVQAMDRDSHSASDTLNRVIPTLSLWLALGLQARAARGRSVR
jgi:hypothetical protein